MAVKFLREATVGTLYGKGEVAGFSKSIEAQLIKDKVAAEHKAKAPAQPRTPAKRRAPKPAKAAAPPAAPTQPE